MNGGQGDRLPKKWPQKMSEEKHKKYFHTKSLSFAWKNVSTFIDAIFSAQRSYKIRAFPNSEWSWLSDRIDVPHSAIWMTCTVLSSIVMSNGHILLFYLSSQCRFVRLFFPEFSIKNCAHFFGFYWEKKKIFYVNFCWFHI